MKSKRLKMQHLLSLLLLISTAAITEAKLEMTPKGFLPLEIKTPNKTLDRLMELSKSWAPYYNKEGYDVSEVTENSLTIEARSENAYYYYNVGVKYNCDIRYSMKIAFKEDKTYTLTFSVKEIYAENVLTKTTTADFFTADGKLKNDFKDAKPSLEKTANSIVKSYRTFIAN